MKVLISIDCGNAAFDDGMEGVEVARILRELAEKVDERGMREGDVYPARDVNGNRVGELKVKRG